MHYSHFLYKAHVSASVSVKNLSLKIEKAAVTSPSSNIIKSTMAQLNSTASSDSSSGSPRPVRVFKRPSRSKKLPVKLRELQDEHEAAITFKELELEQSSKYNPGENVGENMRIICENYTLFSRAISSDRAHFSPFRRLFLHISRARAVTRVIR